MISFIVSALNRPLHLRCCLASLAIQDVEMEVIVYCNSPISCPTSTAGVTKRGVLGNMIWAEVLRYSSGFTFANTSGQVLPLSKEGTHWPSNLLPCCKPCNSKKRDKLWFR